MANSDPIKQTNLASMLNDVVSSVQRLMALQVGNAGSFQLPSNLSSVINLASKMTCISVDRSIKDWIFSDFDPDFKPQLDSKPPVPSFNPKKRKFSETEDDESELPARKRRRLICVKVHKTKRKYTIAKPLRIRLLTKMTFNGVRIHGDPCCVLQCWRTW